MLERLFIKLGFVFLLSGSISGCLTESVPPKDNDPDDNTTFVETNYLPYELLSFSTAKTFSNSLGLIDSQNPTSTTLPSITSTGTELSVLKPRFNQGTFSLIDSSLSNYRLDTLLLSQDNQLFKLDIFNVLNPQRIKLSSEFQANIICHNQDVWAEDFVDFDNSRYVYYIASDCQSNNGEWHMVNLSMTEQQSPEILSVGIKHFMTSILDNSTGAFDGWLVVDTNGFLIQYDPEFTQAKTVQLNNNALLINNYSAFLNSNSLNQFLLSIDEKIVWYNPQTKLVENSVEVFSATPLSHIYQWRSDGLHLYFTINHFAADGVTVQSSSLYRVLLQNASQSDVELLSNESEKISNLEVGSTGVTFSVGEKLRRYSNITFSITDLNPPDNFKLSRNAQGLPVFFVSDDVLLAEYSSVSNSNSRQVKIIGTTINTTLTDSYIVGLIYQKSWQTIKSRGIEKVILEVQGESSGSRVVSALKPVEYPVMLTLGTLPVDATPRPLTRFNSLGHDDILLQGIFNSVVELFFIDAGKGGSLVQVTQNQTTERVVDF